MLNVNPKLMKGRAVGMVLEMGAVERMENRVGGREEKGMELREVGQGSSSEAAAGVDEHQAEHRECLRSIPRQCRNLVASLVALMVKNPPAMQETQVPSLDREDPREKGMATHSSILAWRIPMDREPGGLQSMGSQSQT